MTLSNAELEAIEARAQKATPGPWRLCTRAIISDDTVMTTIASCEQSARSTVEQQEYDADFIAAARSDIPTLLTALRERDAEIAGLRKDIAIKRRALLATRPLVQNFAGDSDDNNRIYELVCAALSQDKGT